MTAAQEAESVKSLYSTVTDAYGCLGSLQLAIGEYCQIIHNLSCVGLTFVLCTYIHTCARNEVPNHAKPSHAEFGTKNFSPLNLCEATTYLPAVEANTSVMPYNTKHVPCLLPQLGYLFLHVRTYFS